MRSIIELKSGILDIDTIEEGSEIFVLNDGGLLDSGADLRDIFEIDTLNSEIVLLFFLLGDLDSFGSIDSFVHFKSKEVLDFSCLR